MSADEVTTDAASRAYDQTLGEMMDLVDRWDGQRWKGVAGEFSTRLLGLYQIARREGQARGTYRGRVFRLNNSVMACARQLRVAPGFGEDHGEAVRKLCQDGLDCAVDLQIELFGDVSSVDEV